MKPFQSNMRYSSAIFLTLASFVAGATGCTKSGKVSLPEQGETKPAPAAQATPPAATEADVQTNASEVPAAAAAPAVAPQTNALSSKGVHMVSGQVFARQSASLGFQVSGFLKSIIKDAGDTVAEGDVLATLDDTDSVIQMQVAEARLEQAKAAYLNAKAEFDREKQLQSASASSASSFDLRRSAYEQAKAARDLADLEVKRSALSLERTKLKAPFSGVISSRSRDVSEQVNPGAEVYTIVSNDRPEVRLQVPEQLLTNVKVGQKVAIRVPSLGVKTEAEVTRVVPVISDKTRSFLVYADVSSDVKSITPGLFVEGQITLDGSH